MLCYFSRHMFSKVRSVILQTLSKVSALSHSLENVMGHSLCRVFILKARGSSASVTTMWSSNVHNDSIGCWLLRKSARWKLVRSAMTRSRIHATMNQLLWSFSEAQRRSTCTGKRHLYLHIDAKRLVLVQHALASTLLCTIFCETLARFSSHVERGGGRGGREAASAKFHQSKRCTRPLLCVLVQ